MNPVIGWWVGRSAYPPAVSRCPLGSETRPEFLVRSIWPVLAILLHTKFWELKTERSLQKPGAPMFPPMKYRFVWYEVTAAPWYHDGSSPDVGYFFHDNVAPLNTSTSRGNVTLCLCWNDLSMPLNIQSCEPIEKVGASKRGSGWYGPVGCAGGSAMAGSGERGEGEIATE